MTDKPAPQTPQAEAALMKAQSIVHDAAATGHLSDKGRSALLAALGHGDCVPRSWAGLNTLLDDHYPPDVFTGSSGDKGPRIVALTRALERAEAERDRMRACLSVLLRDIDEGEVTGGDPECVDLWVTVNRAELDEARAALDGEDTA